MWFFTCRTFLSRMESLTMTLVAFVLLLCFPGATFTSEESLQVKIGALYKANTESLLRLLEYVIDYNFNHKPNRKFALVSVKVDGEDLLSNEVLSALSRTVSIIDLACEDKKAPDLSALVHVPMVTVDPNQDASSHEFVMSVRPSYHVVNQALFDVMDSFSFSKVAVVYDASRIKQASHFFAKARRWPRFDVYMIPELQLHDREELRRSLMSLRKSHIKDIVLFCDQRDLVTIMNEALYVGINDKSYRWITSELEVAGPNQTNPAILGMVGLGLHLSDQRAARILKVRATLESGVEHSLSMYSAVKDSAIVVGQAIQEFIRNSGEGMQLISKHSSNVSCPLHSEGRQHEELGWRLLQEIRKVKFQGLTGEVQFNPRSGERRVHSGLDLLNIKEFVVPNNQQHEKQVRVQKIGSWQPDTGRDHHHVSLLDNETPLWVGDYAERVKCLNPGVMIPREKKPSPVLSIITVLEPPFVEEVNKSVQLPAGKIPKGLLHGFCIDLIEALSKEAKFDYDIYLHHSYVGMVEELKKKTKDIALAPITITAERELDIDFSKPFMDFSMSLIMQKPGEPKIDIFAFLSPFTSGVWLSTIAVVIGMTIAMCVLDYLSPFGYHSRAREAEDQQGNEFNLLNSLWFATASVLQQGPDHTPRAPSGRIMAAAFWFFILILISTYTANLAAFFTIKRTVATINSLEELENQTEFQYGVLDNGSVQTFFKTSEDPLYTRMFLHMRDHKTAVKSTAEGIRKARTEKYAYITEKPYLEYYDQQKPCNTRLLNNLLQAKGYGIALQGNSPYTNDISVAILDLRERNFIEKTRRKWWDERSQCPKPSKSKTGNTKSLEVDNMAGVFLVLIGGFVTALLLLIIEIRCKKLVVYFTSGQKSQRPATRDSEELVDTPTNPVRVAVVLSQGNKILTPRNETKPKTSRLNNWFGKAEGTVR
ncbi:Glutamate receptor 2 [Acropora cervicornis]|uniref:Glutamate receptor 2 n=1 Tax=Acropora cervicornis TaxID=6130 RepID=A0AAD9R6N5_ACRCE|nr:Glutamate receptor 2 [Acropora cervicornis]